MYEGNAGIDNPDNEWTPESAERLFIFCQFDRAMPYEKVRWAYDRLMEAGFYSFEKLRSLSLDELTKILKIVGLRFPRETAGFLYENIRMFTGERLMKMSRDDLAKECKGFGMKLASMFHNRIHGTQYAIIDVHVDRYLKEHGCKSSNYKKKEEFLTEMATSQGKTVEQLDWEIWNANRIGNR